MTQIKIEVPANDHIALSAMADALQRIASERHEQDVFSGLVSKAEEGYSSAVNELTESFTRTVKVGDESITETTVKPYQSTDTHGGEKFDVELNRLDKELEASTHHENTKHDEAFEEAVNTLPDYETSIANFHTEPRVRDAATEQDDTLDDDGIPHDKRIHSKGATRLADNTWRLRKRPADKTEEEWTAYIDSVKAELKAVQDIPSVEPEKLNDIGVAISDEKLEEGSVLDVAKKTLEASLDEQAVADLTPSVIDEPAVQFEGVTPNGDVVIEPPATTGAPVAPVTPPTSLTPPVVEAASDKPSVTTFQELMLYITSNAKKRGADNDMIKSVLLEIGCKRENGDPVIPAIPVLSTRQDLIPKFVTTLEAKLS